MQISNFAIIKNGVVLNVVVGTYVNVCQVASAMYGADAVVVEVYSLYYPPTVQMPVQPNDTYSDGKFYRSGVEIESIPLPADRITALETQNAEQSATIDDIIIAISEG